MIRKPLRMWPTIAVLTGALVLAGCPADPVVRPDDPNKADPDTGTQAVDAGQPAADEPARAPLEAVERPAFDPDGQPPCASHTACYLSAKDAHATGERAGYLLALERCEYYRGRYQLEEFYGLCLLLLADSYRHLNNFDEAVNCYRRFLDTSQDDSELAVQARAGMDEVASAAHTPYAYRDYLLVVSLLTRYGREARPELLDQAEELLVRLKDEQPDWLLAENVRFMLDQIAKQRPGEPTGEEEGATEGNPDEAKPEPAGTPGTDPA